MSLVTVLDDVNCWLLGHFWDTSPHFCHIITIKVGNVLVDNPQDSISNILISVGTRARESNRACTMSFLLQNLHSGYDSLLEGDTVTSEVEMMLGDFGLVLHLLDIKSGGEGQTGLLS